MQLTIQTKTVLVNVCVSLLTVIVFALVIIPDQENALKDDLAVQGENLSAAIESTTLTSLSRDDLTTIVEICSPIVTSRRDIAYIVIAKPNGESCFFLDEQWYFEEENTGWSLPADTNSRGRFTTTPLVDEEVYEYSSLMDYKGLRLGYMHIGLRLDNYSHQLVEMYARTGLTALCILLLSVVVSTFLSRRISRPIVSLKNFTQGVIERGFKGDRIAIATGDEIQDLAHAFNNMAESIELSQQELLNAHNMLEKRVEMRTMELSRANARLTLMLEMFTYCREGICITDAEGFIQESNPAYAQMVGTSMKSLVGLDPVRALLRDDCQFRETVREMWETVRETGEWEGEFADPEGNLGMPILQIGVSAIENESGYTSHFVFIIRDVTELKAKERLIQHQVNHDALTGLPNRKLIAEHIRSLLAGHTPMDGLVALLFIDLDNFKYINDTYGHRPSDSMLVQVGERLKKLVRKNDFVGRLGGDEFIIVCSGFNDRDGVVALTEKVTAAFDDDLELADGTTVRLSASSGVAVYPKDGKTFDQLLINSDLAMYKAKSQGKAQAVFYDSEVHETIRESYALETRLKQAIADDEFTLHYQPIMDAKSMTVTKMEALVRWQQSDGSFIPPDKFIPVAEKSYAIQDLTQLIIEKAFTQLSQWKTLGWKGAVAINLSARSLQNHDIIEYVLARAAACQLDMTSVELEITETSFMQNFGIASTVINDLRATGVSIVLDDFGTGYSSLQYLAELPFESIKIDRSFVRNMLEHKTSRNIVKSIISLAGNLKCKVVAEGVETSKEAEMLLGMNCHYLQGYHFSRPLPADKATAFLFSDN